MSWKNPIRVAVLLSLLTGGCTKHDPPNASPQATPIVELALNEDGAPQLNYTDGPGVLNYRYSLSSFTFEVGPVSGTPWISVKGEADVGSHNSLVLGIHSSSDRAYEIQLLGISKNDGAAMTENQAKETLHIPAGDQDIKIERFINFKYNLIIP